MYSVDQYYYISILKATYNTRNQTNKQTNKTNKNPKIHVNDM